MVAKRRPTYDLEAFKKACASADRLPATGAAFRTALAIGFDREGIVATIQSMRREQFYKSMTAYADRRAWQDVYHVPSDAGLLYVKFTADAVTVFRLLSFKEK